MMWTDLLIYLPVAATMYGAIEFACWIDERKGDRR